MKAMISAMVRLGKAMRDPLFNRLVTVSFGFDNMVNYQLPKSTITDHLKDCFGFLCYKRNDRFDEFVDAFHNALLKEMPWLKGMGV